MTLNKQDSFYKNLLALAIPIALQNMLVSSAHLVDTAMIVSLGNVATSAVGVANRWSFLINLVLFGFMSGSSVMISQYWGAKEKENIQRTYGIALACAMLLSFVYMLAVLAAPTQLLRVFTDEAEVIEEGVKYIRILCLGSVLNAYNAVTSSARRATEDVRVPLVVSVSSTLVNMVLNYILIYGHFGFPRLGVRGAAYATLISIALQSAAFLLIGAKQKHFTFASPKRLLDIEKHFAAKYFKLAAPVIFNETLWAVCTNVYIMIFARRGSENYAAYTVFNSVEQLGFSFFVGVCNACAIMVGKRIGAGESRAGYDTAKRCLRITPIMAIFVGALLIAVRNPILSLLNIETEGARAMASRLLLFYGCWLAMRMIPYTSVVGIFRAGGDSKTGFYIDVLVMMFWSIPVVMLLEYILHAPFLWLVCGMYIAEDTVKSFFSILHFRSRKWIKPLTMSGQNAMDMELMEEN